MYEVSFKCNVLIHSDGRVEWVPPAIFKSSCPINVEYFPFDKQICEMQFGSWTFGKDEVKLKFYANNTVVDLNDYVVSGTWLISDVPGRIDNTGGGGSEYATLTFEIHLKRMTLFYTVNLVIPCVMLTLLAVTVFYLPVDCGEKMSLAINLLLALVVFLLLISSVLPPNAITLPLISKYLLFTFVLNIITILMTTIIQNWNFRGPTTHKMPKWVRTIVIEKLPRYLYMRRPKDSSTQENSFSFTNANSMNCLNLNESSEVLDMHHPGCRHVVHQQATQVPDAAENSDGVVLSPDGLKTASAIEFIAEHLHLEDTVSEVKFKTNLPSL